MNESIFSAEYAERRAQVPKGIPLVVTLSGVSDPGGVVSQLDAFLWDRCEPEEILRFNTDLLLDYRARRPVITFNEDHFIDYSPEELTLSLCRDQLGSPFLLLSGFEPDFRWEQFVDTLLLLVAEFEVSVTVWAHAVPMPVPHTRPLRATVSGTRDDLIEERSVWKPTTKLPASLTHLLEYRLHSMGEEVVGFAILVPHYLSGNEYPDALLFALDSIMAATGLIVTTDEVRERTHEFRAQVDRQVSENEDSIEMLRGLEARYDAYVEDQGSRTPLISDEDALPTADQLASELERFLAQYREDNSQGE
ncbi:PAC2 family protein [Leucobacter sp. UT-8R-CII-1-4]|uniref:proteasome assembly chaperone family protein n=1 Tax=Leucobacter sp. UT-8R-CII-1-4 TaxID=3040075 RepID=UPI0024A9C8CF|nr:PAC2 family protein [Leucobacter sp. UT-8R-CII-1-4]MDI6024298.1 PAC2 family protein [Leucobacter sp. UT-8R-CII-1-4]